MRCLLAALLCAILLRKAFANAISPENSPHQTPQNPSKYDQGTIVCIEVRPPGPGQIAPTKVCGPVINPQKETENQQPHQKSVEKYGISCEENGKLVFSDEHDAIQAESWQPTFMQRPQGPPAIFPRMELSNMVDMPFEMLSRRQGAPPPPPCSQMGLGPRPLPLPVIRNFPDSLSSSRGAPMWQPGSNMQPPGNFPYFRPFDDQLMIQNLQSKNADSNSNPSNNDPNKETTNLLALLKECDEKTKLIMEKDNAIEELQNKIKEQKPQSKSEEPIQKPQQAKKK